MSITFRVYTNGAGTSHDVAEGDERQRTKFCVLPRRCQDGRVRLLQWLAVTERFQYIGADQYGPMEYGWREVPGYATPEATP